MLAEALQGQRWSNNYLAARQLSRHMTVSQSPIAGKDCCPLGSEPHSCKGHLQINFIVRRVMVEVLGALESSASGRQSNMQTAKQGALAYRWSALSCS